MKLCGHATLASAFVLYELLDYKKESIVFDSLSGPLIVTAPSFKQDFVARFFAPKLGILEDPVTGSAYTQLTPYWSERIGKTKLSAKQVSQRGRQVFCEIKGNRVFISGRAVKYMEGLIEF